MVLAVPVVPVVRVVRVVLVVPVVPVVPVVLVVRVVRVVRVVQVAAAAVAVDLASACSQNSSPCHSSCCWTAFVGLHILHNQILLAWSNGMMRRAHG